MRNAFIAVLAVVVASAARAGTASPAASEPQRLVSEAGEALRAARDATAEARTRFETVLRRFPTAPESPQAAAGFVATFATLEQAGRAIRDLERARGVGPNAAARLWSAVAARHASEGRYQDAAALYRDVHARYSETASASFAVLHVAECYEALGDEKQMVEWYERAAALDSRRADGEQMSPADARGIAIEALATHYMRKERWQEALHWWERFRGYGWCGNGLAAQADQRVAAIAHCQARLGRPQEARRLLEQRVFHEKEWLAPAPELAVALVEQHRAAGTLAALVRRLNDAAAADAAHLQAIRVAREYVAMLQLAERRDVEGLWAYFGHTVASQARIDAAATGDWKVRHAARLLIQLGEPTAAVAAGKIRSRDSAWASVLLAKLRGERALDYILSAIAREETFTSSKLRRGRRQREPPQRRKRGAGGVRSVAG
jgi:tetratricopeptide (TPR) repeat protein